MASEQTERFLAGYKIEKRRSGLGGVSHAAAPPASMRISCHAEVREIWSQIPVRSAESNDRVDRIERFRGEASRFARDTCSILQQSAGCDCAGSTLDPPSRRRPSAE